MILDSGLLFLGHPVYTVEHQLFMLHPSDLALLFSV